MRQIVAFIGLKIIEIGGFIFIPYYIGKLLAKIPYWLFKVDSKTKFSYWTNGILFGIFAPLVGLGLVVMIVLILCGFVLSNWQWAGSF